MRTHKRKCPICRGVGNCVEKEMRGKRSRNVYECESCGYEFTAHGSYNGYSTGPVMVREDYPTFELGCEIQSLCENDVLESCYCYI